MATPGNPSPPPIRTKFASDEKSGSGISWPWLKWFQDLFTLVIQSVVTSVFGRTGTVTAQAGDYPPALGGTGQTNWQKGNLLAGTGPNATTLLAVGAGTTVLTADPTQASGMVWSMPAGASVTSVFGRGGAVTAVAGDYGPATGGTGQTSWIKGNLLVGQAIDTTALLIVGADTSFLVSDSSAANGVRWGGFGDGEVPAGTVDGVNVTFTLAKTPNPVTSAQLFENIGGGGAYALQVQPTNYSITGNTLTYVVAPTVGTKHLIWYRA